MGGEIMTQPKVSVVIPIWNTEKYLEKCLASIVNQTLKDIEIICVNNGSTDSSAQIIDKFAQQDSRIKVITIEHGYLSDARNKGTEQVTGKYLYFCDSDDWLELTAFEELYNYSEKLDLDFCFLQENRIYEGETELANIKHRLLSIYGCDEEQVYTYHNMKNIFLPRLETWLHFYKTEFYKKENLYFPSKTFYEDVVVHFKSIFLASKIGFYHKPLYYHLMRKTSALEISHNTAEKLDSVVFLESLFDFLKERKLLDTYKKDYIDFMFAQMEYHRTNCSVNYQHSLIQKFKKFVTKNKEILSYIQSNKNYKTKYKNILQNGKNKSKLKPVFNFIKAYLLFPWYVYKTYKLVQKGLK